jgi:hypothetical protein
MFVLVEVAGSTATRFSVGTKEKFPPSKGDPGDGGVKLRDPGGSGCDSPVRLFSSGRRKGKRRDRGGDRAAFGSLGGGAGL